MAGMAGRGGGNLEVQGEAGGDLQHQVPHLSPTSPCCGSSRGGEGTCSTCPPPPPPPPPPPLLSALFSSPSPCCGCSSGGEGICHPPGADAAVGGGDLQHLPAPPAPPPPPHLSAAGAAVGEGMGVAGVANPPALLRPARPAALCAPCGRERERRKGGGGG
ncbi:unnamed protein product [Closterium sp. Naga37s-1]|nr:unnamed protein product [Closterium sp. Naga37s-1]